MGRHRAKSSHNFYFNVKIFRIEHNNHRSLWRHQRTKKKNILTTWWKSTRRTSVTTISRSSTWSTSTTTSNDHDHDQNDNSRLHYLQRMFAQQQTSWRTSFSGNNSDNNNYDIGHHHHILVKEKEERKHQEGEWGHPHWHQQHQYSIVTTTGRRHRPKASIIVTTLFSILYFVSLFTSKLDILLPSYAKSASESVHQLYRTSQEAQSYLDCLEELSHPTIHFTQYIMSRAASDIGDIGGIVGGGHQPPSPPTPASPPQPLGPLDLYRKHEIIKMFSEFHIKRDASYIAPASMDFKDIYNRFEELIIKPDLNIEEVIHRYFRACPPHRNDTKIGYIILNDHGYFDIDQHDRIQLSNIDTALQLGFPNLYQHIHLHQQAADAINFKITSKRFLVRTTSLMTTGSEITSQGVFTSSPSPSRLISLGQGTSYVLTGGVITTSGLWAQPAYISTTFTHQQHWSTSDHHQGPYSAEHLWQDQQPGYQQLTSVRSDIDQWTPEQQCAQPSQPLQPRSGRRHVATSRPTSRTRCTSWSGRSRLRRQRQLEGHQVQVHQRWPPTSSTQRELQSPSSTAMTWTSTDIRGYVKTSMSQSALFRWLPLDSQHLRWHLTAESLSQRKTKRGCIQQEGVWNIQDVVYFWTSGPPVHLGLNQWTSDIPGSRTKDAHISETTSQRHLHYKYAGRHLRTGYVKEEMTTMTRRYLRQLLSYFLKFWQKSL